MQSPLQNEAMGRKTITWFKPIVWEKKIRKKKCDTTQMFLSFDSKTKFQNEFSLILKQNKPKPQQTNKQQSKTTQQPTKQNKTKITPKHVLFGILGSVWDYYSWQTKHKKTF